MGGLFRLPLKTFFILSHTSWLISLVRCVTSKMIPKVNLPSTSKPQNYNKMRRRRCLWKLNTKSGGGGGGNNERRPGGTKIYTHYRRREGGRGRVRGEQIKRVTLKKHSTAFGEQHHLSSSTVEKK